MSVETNVILKFRREHDSWVCSECDAENFSFHKQCVICGHMKNSSDPVLKAWTEADEYVPLVPKKTPAQAKHSPAAAPAKVFTDRDGYVVPEKKRKTGVKIFWGILIALVIIAGLAGLFIFSDTEVEENSTYTDAMNAYDAGEFKVAIELFESLPSDYKDVSDMIMTCKYSEAEQLMETNNYYDAYRLYDELDDYKNSNAQKRACGYEWLDYILDNDLDGAISEYEQAVEIDETDHQRIYSTIKDKVDAHKNFDSWYTSRAQLVSDSLELLPESYQDVEDLKQLFSDIADQNITNYSYDYVRDNGSFLERVWDIEFVQDYLKGDNIIEVFLEGYWSDSSGNFLSFYENDEGGTTSRYNLPEPYRSASVKYYDIEDGIYIWTDEDSNELSKVFKITVNNYDSAEVYCYSNARSYYLSR